MSTGKPGVVVTQARDLPLTVFLPKESQTNYGMFDNDKPGSKVEVWCRLGASHVVGYNENTREYDNQWGQIVLFDNLARKLGKIMNESDTDHVNIRVYARQETNVNIKDKEIYLNVSWVVWGFEYDNVFYTTQDGQLMQAKPTVMRGTRGAQRDDDKDTLRRREDVKKNDSRMRDNSRPSSFNIRG